MADCKRCFLGENDDCYPHVAEDKECDFFRPKTNADRIRSMTNAELARFFDNIETKNYFGEYLGELGWLKWLQQEV